MSRRVVARKGVATGRVGIKTFALAGPGIAIGLLAHAVPAGAAEFSVGDGGSLRVMEGERSFQLAGRAVMGAAIYEQDVTPLESGVDMDLALLAARANFGNGWNLNVSYDLQGSSFFDASITKSGLAIGALQVGQFRPQVGLYDGGAWTIFAQRSMIEQALAIPRTLGVGLEGGASRYSYSLAVNGDQIGQETPGHPLKYSTRWVFRPAPANWGTFQVGLNGVYQQTPETRINKVSVNPIPARDMTPTLLKVAHSDADSRSVVGGEVLWAKGPWTLQSEFMRASVNAPDFPHFYGYYAQGVYALGAHRDFSEESGTLGRPHLWNPAAGAWEFALRYDAIDLGSASGGAAANWSLALVRYFSNPLRVGATLARSSIRDGLNGDEVIKSIQLKAQWFL